MGVSSRSNQHILFALLNRNLLVQQKPARHPYPPTITIPTAIHRQRSNEQQVHLTRHDLGLGILLLLQLRTILPEHLPQPRCSGGTHLHSIRREFLPLIHGL